MPKKSAPAVSPARSKPKSTPTKAMSKSTAADSTVPSTLLLDVPAPRLEVRVFHRTRIPVWVGRVRLDKISGWVANERISTYVKQFEQEFGRPPSNKDLYEILIRHDGEFKIKELSRLIFWNGVKVPIILDARGNLLDGNRRYFASLHLLRSNPEEKADLETIPAYVLQDDISEEDRRKILVEMNFVDDGRVEWSPYVQARAVWREYSEGGMKDHTELAKIFGWPRPKIGQAIEVMQLVQEFIAFHTEAPSPEEGVKRLGDALKAELVAAEYYVYFWEARNKYSDQLDSDPSFKEWFFETIPIDGVIRSLTQVRVFGECWKHEDTRNELLTRTAIGIKRAHAMHQARNEGLTVEGPEALKPEAVEKKVKDFTRWINERLSVGGLKLLSPGTLKDLREALTSVSDACAALNKPGS